MRKTLISTLALLLFASFSQADEKLVKKMLQPMVHISKNNQLVGTGTIINSYKKKDKTILFVLTAFHVIKEFDKDKEEFIPRPSINISLPEWDSRGHIDSIKFVQSKCVEYHIGNDFAILHATIKTKEDVPTVICASKETIDKMGVFDKVYTVGATLGQHSWATDGLIASLSVKVRMPVERLIGVSSPGGPGSSGGPVYNDKHEMIGFFTGGITKVVRAPLPAQVMVHHMGLVVPLDIIYNNLGDKYKLYFNPAYLNPLRQ